MKQSIKKTRILKICGGDFSASGSSVVAWRWYQNIDPNQFHIDFFCFYSPDKKYIQEIDSNGSRCIVRTKRNNMLLTQAVGLQQLRKIVREGHYDCIHIHNSTAYMVLPIFIICKKYTNKVLIHSNNTGVGQSALKKTLHAICKQFLRSRQFVPIASSLDAAKWLFPRRIIQEKRFIIVFNGIDVQRFSYNQEIRTRLRSNELGLDDQFVIGHIGRFGEQKNHSFLIDIFAEVHKKCPDAILFLVGDNTNKDNLKEQIRKKVETLGLMQNVIFYGNTDRIHEMYQAMDCFVFPSVYEGFGIVAAEAQAAGLKTLCSNAIPQEVRVTELFEYLSLADAPEKWANRILSYNNGYERENTFQQLVDAGFDIRTTARQLEEIYLTSNSN